jgi:hypothetical protein
MVKNMGGYTEDYTHMNISRTSLTLTIVATLLFVPAAFAVPISGELDISGSDATVGLLNLLFNCNPGITLAPCPAPAPQTGNFTTTGASASFAPYTTQGGYEQSLSQATTPLNQTFLLSNFLIFSNTVGNPVLPPDIALDLRFIFLGVNPNTGFVNGGCPTFVPNTAQPCTPAFAGLVTAANPNGLSAFNLQNTQTGSTASFSVMGTSRRISTGEVSNFTGVFSAQFTSPYQSLLATLGSGGTVTNSYSATFTSTVIPEPETTVLVLGGLLLVVGGCFRRFSRKQ